MECTCGSDTGIRWSCDVAFLLPFHHSPSFSSFYYFNSNFWYIDMHPTLAGFYPFLLGSPARCAFLLYLYLYICLGSSAISQLSFSAVALTSSLSLTQDGACSQLQFHSNLLQSRDVATFCISITFSPFFIFFIISLFQLRFLVYRHTSHLSRALSFSFRIPC